MRTCIVHRCGAHLMRYCFLYICADLRSQPYSQSSANIARPLIRASVSLSRDMPVCFPSFHQVHLDGQRLRHESHPTYLRVTPDCTLSYRENLKKTAGKLKNRNNLLMKLAGCNIHIAPERSKTQRHSEDRAKPSKIKALYS